MSSRLARPRRLGVASLASMAVVAALSVAMPTALTGGAHAATGSGPHRSAVAPDRPAVRHLSASLPHESVATAVTGTVYVADYSGQVLAIAPDGSASQVGTGWGAPYGVAVDAAGDLFVTDADNGTLVELAADGTQTTLASGFSFPLGVAVDTDGNVYVGENGTNQVVEVAPDGTQTVLPFEGLSCPNGIAVDAQDNVYAADYCSGNVSELTPDGTETTVGGGYSQPTGVAVDGDGNVFVADIYNNRVEEVTPGGVQTTVPNSDTGAPTGVEVDANGNVYIADLSGGNYQLTTDGGRTPLASTYGGYDIGVFGSRPRAGLQQKIGFTSDAPTKAHPGNDYTVSAIGGGSGNPVTFSTQSDGACTVDDNGDGTADVSLDHAGDCVIDADQAGNDDYNAAPQAHQTVAVHAYAQEIGFTTDVPTGSVPGDDYTVSAYGGESGNPVTFSSSTDGECTVTDNGDGSADVSLDHPGKCVIDADQAGNADFADAPQAHQTVTVAQAAQPVTFTSSPGLVRVGDSYTATATGGGSDNPVTFAVAKGSSSSCTVSPTGEVTFLHATGCTVVASQAGTGDYLDGSATQVINVRRAIQTVVFTSNAPHHARAGTTYHATATGNTASGTKVRITGVGACSVGRQGVVRFDHRGSCAVFAHQAGSADYLAGKAKQLITVLPARTSRGGSYLGTTFLG